jgi:hypothetical protein
VWELERRETELRQEPPDPVLEADAAWYGGRQSGEGRPGTCRRPGAGYETNALAMRLNVRRGGCPMRTTST